MNIYFKYFCLLCGLLVQSLCVNAQDGVAYFVSNDLPNLIKCLPGPPDSTSAMYHNDILQYMWGKQQRANAERAEIARMDAIQNTTEDIASPSAVPFGLHISAAETPEIYKLLNNTYVTISQMTSKTKEYYKRMRPFVRFKEHVLTQELEEDNLGYYKSFPSGHATRGWATALILSEIAPHRADTILSRGYMYGDSRLIVGAHWQSDVDADRLVASIAYCRLQTSAEFCEQMKKAQQEYREKTGSFAPTSISDSMIRKGCDYYYTRDEMPDMRRFLPAPPDSMNHRFALDVMQYLSNKEKRQDEERADIAVRDAVYGVDCICREFSTPFGLQISEQDTPEIYKLLVDATSTCDSICFKPKKFYHRRRPFMVFDETSLTPDNEPSLRLNGSYPSGHALLGWSSALILSEVNPECTDTLIARGYMYGDSRLIVGVHWQSDVDAARLAASAAYAKIHTSKRFREQMKKAREEFARLTGRNGDTTAVNKYTSDEQKTDDIIYNLRGQQVLNPRHGIYIKGGVKSVVR